ncbi:hypothetical protein [Streptomyces parvulus]
MTAVLPAPGDVSPGEWGGCGADERLFLAANEAVGARSAQQPGADPASGPPSGP